MAIMIIYVIILFVVSAFIYIKKKKRDSIIVLITGAIIGTIITNIFVPTKINLADYIYEYTQKKSSNVSSPAPTKEVSTSAPANPAKEVSTSAPTKEISTSAPHYLNSNNYMVIHFGLSSIATDNEVLNDITNILNSRMELLKFDGKAICEEQNVALYINKTSDTSIVGDIISKGTFEIQDESKNIIINNNDILDVSATSLNNEPVIYLILNDKAKNKFANSTEKNIGKQLFIYYNGYLIMSPMVQSPINTGEIYIGGFDNIEDAQKMQALLKTPPLPYSLEELP